MSDWPLPPVTVSQRYRDRFPECDVQFKHAFDYQRLQAALESAISRGQPLTNDEVNALGLMRLRDLPEGAVM